MTQEDVLLDVAARLAALGTEWMLVGSVASGVWGTLRLTHDVDMLIALRAEDIGPLVAAVQDDYYVSEEMLADALVYRTPANLIHLTAAEKVDLWVVGEDEHAAASLARRRRETMGGTCVWVSAPEDVILAKLRWLEMGDSLQQSQDALYVAIVQWGHMDLAYMRQWAAKLGLTESLEKLLAEAEQAATG